VSLGTLIGLFIAIACNRKGMSTILSFFSKDGQLQGIPLDTLSNSAIDDSNLKEAYQRAMRTRYVNQPNLLTLINPQEIFLQRIIGEGSFGKVWSAKWGTSTVAVKEFVFAQAAVAGKSMMQQEIIDSIVGEAGMMAILRHPNVLQLFGCSLTAQAIWIVSELCSLGSLRQLLDDHERNIPTHLRLSLALQVGEGIAYLHNQDPPIIHRDLKSHNIFVHETFTSHSFTGSESSHRKSTPNTNKRSDKENASETREEDNASPRATIVAKIGDWGSARASLSRGERTMTHGVGTACWMAPETITKGRSSKYSDVYSFGIILWELWTRKEVYDGLGSAQIIHQVANENLRPLVPEDCPWKDLMVQCWQEIPKDRPDFDQIVEELNKIMGDISDDESSFSKSAVSAHNKSQDEAEIDACVD
jgi:serine/threonine protein kinase